MNKDIFTGHISDVTYLLTSHYFLIGIKTHAPINPCMTLERHPVKIPCFINYILETTNFHNA